MKEYFNPQIAYFTYLAINAGIYVRKCLKDNAAQIWEKKTLICNISDIFSWTFIFPQTSYLVVSLSIDHLQKVVICTR